MPIQKPPYSAEVLGQGIKYPLEYDGKGRLQLSWGADLVEQAIMSICLTEPGERVMLPSYGGATTTFEPLDEGRIKLNIERSIAEHEPRARDVEVNVEPGDKPGEALITVQYQVAGDASPRTLTYPIFVGPSATGASE